MNILTELTHKSQPIHIPVLLEHKLINTALLSYCCATESGMTWTHNNVIELQAAARTDSNR